MDSYATQMLQNECKDCELLNRFLVSAVEQSFKFSANLDRRTHMQLALPADFFHFETVKSKSPHTLVITKLGREHEAEVIKHRDIMQAIRRSLESLQSDYMRELLGNEYEELILLTEGQVNRSNNIVVGGKRPVENGIANGSTSKKRRS